MTNPSETPLVRRSVAPRKGDTSHLEPFPDDAVDATVVKRLWDIADRHSDAVALRGPAGEWTYQALVAHVRAIAWAIQQRIDGSEPRAVALFMEHDAPLVATILGVIAAGHIVVVVDPSAPPEPLAHVVGESRSVLCIHDDTYAEAASGFDGVDTVAAETLRVDGQGQSPEARGDVASPVMLAFTSGTTGDAKAAIITNGVLLNLVRGATNALGIGPDDRMPMLFPTSLAVAAYPMFLPLLNGGTLATLDVRSVGLDPLGPFLIDERITVAYMAPTVIRFCVDAFAGLKFPDLRLLALGGEPVDAEVVALTRELMDPPVMANGFGTTETGVITLYVFDPAVPHDGVMPAGYPVPDVGIDIVAADGSAAAVGESGEVVIHTKYCFGGYLGHPEATAAVLSAVDWAPGSWRYRTGDLGFLDETGALTVTGRIDTKVKIRGRFVVLGDVEARIAQLDAVREAVVVPSRHRDTTTITAHVVLAESGSVDGTQLRAQLLATEEPYRVPMQWVVHDEMPRLANGKTDRARLSAWSSAAEGVDADAPMTPTEETLLGIWRNLLPSAPTGIDDDFAALGGDSLLAAQMLIEVENRLGVTPEMGWLIDARTVRTLAAALDGAMRSGTRDTAICVTPDDPANPARPRLWFVPDLQGSAYRVRHLAAALGEDQPLWSFESPLILGEPNPYRSLDTFVARLLTDLRRHQPEGPYWLAGYSFGGICVYEMARQLVADGHEVAFVGVIDVGPGYRGPGWGNRKAPPRPWFGVAKPPEAGASPAEAFAHYVEMGRQSPARLIRHLSVRSGVAERIDPLRFRADIRRHGRVRPEWRLWYAWQEHWSLAAEQWNRTQPFAGRMDLFWASDTPSADNSQGWGPLVDDLHIHRFDGDHDSLLEPRGVQPLADALRRVLDELVPPTA